MPLGPGLTGRAEMTVGESDIATAFRSGDVPVLATPRVLALAEEATMAAIQGELEPGTTSVGMRVQIDHLQPTGTGSRVVATAVLEKVEGRRLTFAVSAEDDRGTVAEGRVVRVVVDRERFLEKTG